jgi:hypothetical protein
VLLYLLTTLSYIPNLECKISFLMVVKLPAGAHDAPTMTINNDYSQSTPHAPIGIENYPAQNTPKATVPIIVLIM